MTKDRTIDKLMRFAVLAFFALFLAGCAIPNQYTQGILGMTRAQLLACAGAPRSEATEGTTHAMTYDIMISRGVHGSFACNVSLVLKDDKVVRISYYGQTGPCTQIMRACVQE